MYKTFHIWHLKINFKIKYTYILRCVSIFQYFKKSLNNNYMKVRTNRKVKETYIRPCDS